MSDKTTAKELRRIHLTDEQYAAARKVIAAREHIGEVLGKAIAKAVQECADEEAEMWQQLNQIAGIGECDAETVAVEWLSHDLVVREKVTK